MRQVHVVSGRACGPPTPYPALPCCCCCCSSWPTSACWLARKNELPVPPPALLPLPPPAWLACKNELTVPPPALLPLPPPAWLARKNELTVSRFKGGNGAGASSSTDPCAAGSGSSMTYRYYLPGPSTYPTPYTLHPGQWSLHIPQTLLPAHTLPPPPPLTEIAIRSMTLSHWTVTSA